MKTSEQISRWFVIKTWFREWEALQGSPAKLEFPLAYIAAALMEDRMSGWWVAVLTSWVVKV